MEGNALLQSRFNNLFLGKTLIQILIKKRVIFRKRSHHARWINNLIVCKV